MATPAIFLKNIFEQYSANKNIAQTFGKDYTDDWVKNNKILSERFADMNKLFGSLKFDPLPNALDSSTKFTYDNSNIDSINGLVSSTDSLIRNLDFEKTEKALSVINADSNNSSIEKTLN